MVVVRLNHLRGHVLGNEHARQDTVDLAVLEAPHVRITYTVARRRGGGPWGIRSGRSSRGSRGGSYRRGDGVRCDRSGGVRTFGCCWGGGDVRRDRNGGSGLVDCRCRGRL